MQLILIHGNPEKTDPVKERIDCAQRAGGAAERPFAYCHPARKKTRMAIFMTNIVPTNCRRSALYKTCGMPASSVPTGQSLENHGSLVIKRNNEIPGG